MLRYSVHMPPSARQPASIEISGYFGRNTSCTRLGNAQVMKACTDLVYSSGLNEGREAVSRED